ncbi:cadherin-like domain-containing protein [Devosia sp. ZB163]|uniref:calcium-binding protein n=1 Tax=Devosia sp. ZB163 TaxID=3025938 RepID=UPI00236307EC|nr:cadherin-like domain-containing protein [Devosia sp. ZB163]MDC9825129.1 cadherin-like domain-containing protein [Devosia sp. ZB163]
MTIQVKGTKEAEAASPAERYRFRPSQAATRLPLFFGVVLAAVLGFIKTAMSSTEVTVHNEPEATADQRPRGMPSAPSDDASQSAKSAAAEDGETTKSPGVRDDFDSTRSFHRTDNVVPFPVRKHTLVDSPPIDSSSILAPQAPPPIEAEPQAGERARVQGGSSTQSPGSGGGASSGEPQRRNRAPDVRDGPILLQEAFAGTAVVIGLDQLLAQAVDRDGDQLTVRNVTVSSGAIVQTEAGFIYNSGPQAAAGQVQVNFEISDGTTSVPRTAFIPIVRGPVNGTEAADQIAGTEGPDTIHALAGADLVSSLGGDDFIVGGDGDDKISAGAGNDVVWAGAGNDVVLGGDGKDTLSGGDGDDRLAGEAGSDVLLGEAGNDMLLGGADDDTVVGGEGADIIDGGEGADLLQGDAGADEIHDGAGEDIVFGGEGNDLAVAAMDATVDYLEGGEGFDTIDYSAASAPITFDLTAGSIISDEAGDDKFSGFEAVVGGSGADIFMVGDAEMQLTGGDGEDTFIFALPEDVDRPTLVHDILDFVVGDHIQVEAFEFTMSQDEAAEDRFGHYYRDRDEDDPNALRLRIRYVDDDDGKELTVFEFDTDGNFEFEMTVTVQGHQQPFVYETAAV